MCEKWAFAVCVNWFAWDLEVFCISWFWGQYIVIIECVQKVFSCSNENTVTHCLEFCQFVFDCRNPQSSWHIWTYCPKSTISLFLRRTVIDSWLTHFTMLSSVIMRKKCQWAELLGHFLMWLLFLCQTLYLMRAILYTFRKCIFRTGWAVIVQCLGN